MYESFFSFEEYIRDYEQQRAEGLLLRYLMEVYKVLVQTVPESYRNEEIEGMIDYFGRMIRNIDSSLLDEWEKLRNPTATRDEADTEAVQEAPDITRDMRAFTVQIRNEVFRLVRALAAGDAEGALAVIEGGDWTVASLTNAITPYFDDHQAISTDRQARHPQYCRVRPQQNPEGWKVEQTLIDPDEHNDWQLTFFIDRQKSREQNRPVLELLKIGHVDEV
jgi:hypothetical protein